MTTTFRTTVAILLLASMPALSQSFCGAPPAGIPVLDCGNPEFQSCAINVGGIPRHVCVHVPDNPTPPQEIPVVIGFHGGGGQASRAVNWLDKHTEQGMILIAPTALPTGTACSRRFRHMTADAIETWPDFGNPDDCATAFGPWPAGSANTQDLDMVTEILDQVESEYEVSGHYAVGFSNGAGMVYQLMITSPLAERFSGFAFMGNGMTQPKKDAVALGGGFAPYAANTEWRRPAMLIFGTADKVSFPASAAIEAVETMAAQASPPPDCVAPWSPESVFRCFMSNPMGPGLGKHDLVNRIEDTRDWLLQFNGARRRGIEGLYPDKGHAAVPVSEQDATLTVRQDFLAGANGEPVTVLTVVNGRHVVPGASGDYAPCGARNCDINAIEEVLQFWRSHAGLRNIWP